MWRSGPLRNVQRGCEVKEAGGGGEGAHSSAEIIERACFSAGTGLRYMIVILRSSCYAI